MSMLSNLKLATKMSLLLGLSAIAMIAIGVIGAVTLHQRMLDDRIDKLRASVSSAIAIATKLETRVAANEITRQQALDLFHEDVRAIRFDGGAGYLSVIEGRTGNIFMH